MEPISDLKINIRKPKSLSGSNYGKRTSHAQNSCDRLLAQAREACLLADQHGQVDKPKETKFENTENAYTDSNGNCTDLRTLLLFDHY